MSGALHIEANSTGRSQGGHGQAEASSGEAMGGEARVTQAPLPDGVVTLLLGDIEGSVRSWQAAPDSMAEAARRFDALVSWTCSEFGGRRPVEQGEGDSFVAAFKRASDAVTAALALQLAVATEPWPGDLELRVRMAIHTGEVQFRNEGNYAGGAINRCARLRDLAHGGQVLVSGATHELVADLALVGVSFRDLGRHDLRDIPRPELVFQLCHPELPDRFASLPGSAEVTGAPTELTSFIGRDVEIGELAQRIGESRVVTLTGSAGCGKTRLAARVAAHHAPTEPDGAWWVGLADVAEGTSVPAAVATALGVAWLATQDPLDAVAADLATRHMLIVLDNCEHVIAACVELVDRLLRSCPHVRFLATSREQLGLYGELSWRVPSLPTPPANAVEPSTIAAHAAVQLFVDRARQVRPNFQLTASTAPLVAEICRRVDGIPLAVELTAARTRLLGLDQIAEGLRGRFLLLGVSARGNVARQRTLQASVDWSYALLDERERTLLRRLGVFTGGFSLDAAEVVCAGDGLEARDVLDVLGRLVDKSLVQVHFDSGSARYSLLETIREYARSKLADDGEVAAVHDRHLRWILALAEAIEAEIDLTERGARLDALERELGNVRGAIAWAVDSVQADAACRLATALWPLWLTRRPATEGYGHLTDVLALPGGDPRLRAMAMAWHGNLALIGGRVEEAVTTTSEALDIARALGEREVLRRALGNLGWCLLFVAPNDARAAFEEAMALAPPGSVSNSHSELLIGLGWLEILGADWAAADERLATALAIGRHTRDGMVLQEAFLFTGAGSLLRGRLAAADASFREAIMNGGLIRDGLFLSVAWSARCWAFALRGDFDAATNAADCADRIAGEAGAELALAHAKGMRGILECRRLNPHAAIDLCREANEWFGRWGSNWYARRFGLERARAHLIAGDRDAALEHLAVAKAQALDANDRLNLCLAFLLEAELAFEVDRLEAETLAHQALSAAEGAAAHGTATDSLELLGCLAIARGDCAEGGRILNAVDAMRSRSDYRRTATEEARWAQHVGLARDALGDDEWQIVVEEGLALGEAELFGYVRRGRGSRRRPASGWASLTPAELDVVALVADGLSNAQAAAKLFVSAATVKAHLGHVYAKLGISSRAALAAEFSRRREASPPDALEHLP